MNQQRLVINSAHGRPLAQPVMIIVDKPGFAGTAERLLGDAALTRLLGVMLIGSLFGSALHHLLGVGTALVVTFLLVPLLAGTVSLFLNANKDEAERLQGLQNAAKAAFCGPLVILSGSLLGVLSLLFWGAATTAAYGFMNRFAS